MRLADVPPSPAYLVFHDAFDRGAMEVWPAQSIAEAEDEAQRRQEKLDQRGDDDCGVWKAYERLPRVRVWKYHGGR